MKKKLVMLMMATLTIMCMSACSDSNVEKNNNTKFESESIEEVDTNNNDDTEDETSNDVDTDIDVDTNDDEENTNEDSDTNTNESNVPIDDQLEDIIYMKDVTEEQYNGWANKVLEQAKLDGVADETSSVISKYEDLGQTEYLSLGYSLNSLSIGGYYKDGVITTCMFIPMEVDCVDGTKVYLYNISSDVAFEIINEIPKEVLRNELQERFEAAGFRAEEMYVHYDNQGFDLVFVNEDELNALSLEELINVANSYFLKSDELSISASSKLYNIRLSLMKSDMTREELTIARDNVAKYFEYFSVKITAANQTKTFKLEVEKDDSFDLFDDLAMETLRLGNEDKAEEALGLK